MSAPIAVSEQLWKEYISTRSIEKRNEIVMAYSSLVNIIAVQMRGIYKNYAQIDDIVNQGILALIESVEKFDPSRNIKFETFASIRVKGSVIDFIRSQDWIPRRTRKLGKDLDNAQAALFSRMGREPTRMETAEEMGITVEQLDRLLEETYNFNVLSYEEIVYEKCSSAVMSNVEDDPAYSPEASIMEQELRQQLGDAIDMLNERERTVVSLYYYENLKLKEIADVIGVSESRVCQIHSAAMAKMKKKLLSYAKM